MNKSKIILGSAQFRMNYGIIGSKVKSLNDINKIINFAKENNFYGIETAQDYADTEKFLGKTNLGNLKLISKFNIKKNNYKNLKDILNNSFKNLNVDKIFGFLFHNEKEIFTKKGQLFYNQLLELKADGIIKNIGVSVYNLSLSKKILKNFKIDILQIPFSIFDQRFLDKEFIYLITKKNIKIHARSIFLQGMLINNKKYHHTFNNKISDYHNWIKLNALNPVSECIKFANQQKFINKIIIGIDTIENLKNINNILRKPFSNVKIPNEYKNRPINLIRSNKWKKITK